MVALGDPRGDDADHARVPALGREHERVALGVLGDQRLGLEADPGLDVAALGVDQVQLGGDRLRAVAVLGEQQLQPGVGAVQAPGGVQARPEPEADRRLVQPRRVHARDVHQGAQADLARRGQRFAGPGAPGGGSRPGSGTTSATVASATRSRSSSASAGSSPAWASSACASLCATPGRAQVGARVAVEARVHERRVRQRAVRARAVMVGDHDVEPERPRRGHLLDRGDRAVDGDQQVRPARGELVDRGAGEPVAVVDPARQVPVHVGAERAQRAHEDRRRAHAVDVVVAVHGDPRAALDVAVDVRGGLGEPRPLGQRVRVLRRQERAGRGGLPQPAAHQHLRDHVRAAELRRQPRRGGERVRTDLQTRVHET